MNLARDPGSDAVGLNGQANGLDHHGASGALAHFWGSRELQEDTVIFSHVARILAALGVILGASRVCIGLSIVNGWMGLTADDLGLYTTAATTGEAINRGVYMILASVVLGTLAEVGLALRK